MKTPCRALLIALAAIATVGSQAPAFADPPSWAPANGERDHDRDHDGDHDRDWRDERRDDRDRHEDRRDGDHDRDDYRYVRYGHPYWYQGRYVYRGYYNDDWHNDYGVVRTGRCDTNVWLGAAGAVTGAVIGNRSASPYNQGVATIFGAIAGGIIGSAVGSAIDNGDRACMGQTLELAPIGHPVYWQNPHSRVYWRMVPVRDVSPVCREFQVYREFNGHRGGQRIVACRRYRGAWDIRG
jgi:surface antigen